jgi:hypothetical protein
MLWTLLIATSSMALIGGALAALRTVTGGARHYVLASLSGLLLAAANAWTWNRLGHAVDRYVRPLSQLRRERYLRLLYLAAAIWFLCAGVLGIWITSAVLRLAR